MMQDSDGKLNAGLPRSARRRLFTTKLDLNLKNKLVKYHIRSAALYGAETWTLEK
jgi:hypothetical protein